jgi:catechol-2,3-dioxygenase
MNITGLGRASLKVRDLAASERFYSRILRMPVVSRSTPRSGARAGIEFRVGHAHEFVVEPADELASGNAQAIAGVTHLAFVVGNNPRTLDDAARHLTEQGVPFEQVARDEYESLLLRDPDGHLIELYYWPEW